MGIKKRAYKSLIRDMEIKIDRILGDAHTLMYKLGREQDTIIVLTRLLMDCKTKAEVLSFAEDNMTPDCFEAYKQHLDAHYK